LRWQNTPDGRSRGTFTQFVREAVAAHRDGFSREELIASAQRSGKIHRLPRSRGNMLEAIARMLRLGELIEEEQRLYAGPVRTAAARRRGR
jgi:hypothetical protein